MKQHGGAACGRIWRQGESKFAVVVREFARLP